MPHELRPAVFLHIQKTAGTSVREMASRAYGKRNVISHGDYERLGLEASNSVPFVSGHFGFAFCRELMADRFSFAFLRHPEQRLLSLYRFLQTQDPEVLPMAKIAQSTDLLGFLEPTHGEVHWSTVWNHQTLQLAHGYGAGLAGKPDLWGWELAPDDLLKLASAHLDLFDYIGLTEEFKKDIGIVFRMLGARLKREVPRSNVTNAGSRLHLLSPRERRRLSEVTELDAALYDNAVRARKRLKRLLEKRRIQFRIPLRIY